MRAAVLLLAILVSVVPAGLGGCSAYMAANQPGQKDFSVFRTGTPRGKVIAEFGTPMHSEQTPQGKQDIFKFVQGYHGAVRAGRAVAHGAATVATLGLWEVIGTPIEGHMNGTELSVRVTYDHLNQVAKVDPLKGEEEVMRNLESVSKQPPAETASTVQ